MRLRINRERAQAAAAALREHRDEVAHAIRCLETYAQARETTRELVALGDLQKAIAIEWRTRRHIPPPGAELHRPSA